jgi:hypothetical protein
VQNGGKPGQKVQNGRKQDPCYKKNIRIEVIL